MIVLKNTKFMIDKILDDKKQIFRVTLTYTVICLMLGIVYKQDRYSLGDTIIKLNGGTDIYSIGMSDLLFVIFQYLSIIYICVSFIEVMYKDKAFFTLIRNTKFILWDYSVMLTISIISSLFVILSDIVKYIIIVIIYEEKVTKVHLNIMMNSFPIHIIGIIGIVILIFTLYKITNSIIASTICGILVIVLNLWTEIKIVSISTIGSFVVIGKTDAINYSGVGTIEMLVKHVFLVMISIFLINFIYIMKKIVKIKCKRIVSG